MLAMIGPFLPYLLIGAAVLGLWGTHKIQVASAHHTGYVEGKQEQRAADEKQAAEAAEQAKVAAQGAVDGVAADAKRDREQRDAIWGQLLAKARNVHGTVCAPSATPGVLADVTAQANAARAAGRDSKGADPVPRAAPSAADITYYDAAEWNAYAANAGAAYADAYGQWDRCVRAWNSVREKLK